MRRTNSPKFELWHTFATIVAMLVALQIFNGLSQYVAAAENRASMLGLSVAGGFLFLVLLAVLFLTRELFGQAKLLIQGMRGEPVRIRVSRDR